MATNIKLLVILKVIGMTMIYSTCRKPIDCSQTIYSFEAFFKAYPDLDSLRVGDTLFLEFNSSTMLNDVNRSQLVNFAGAENLGTVLSFTEFAANQQEIAAVDNFELKLHVGKLSLQTINPARNREYLFEEHNNEYQFKLGISPKKAGRYAITIANSNNVYTRTDRCSKANFSFRFNNTNQHFHLVNQWRPDLILQEPGKSRVYYFLTYQ